ISESVVTTNELAPVVGQTGAVVTVFQKYARAEGSTETVVSTSASLPSLYTGSMGTSARTTGFEYRESPVEPARLTTNTTQLTTIS
ncbi:hypothetical protein EBZ39_11630, partial [bacterium]|nr:hypothetical protein [bacterium]